MRRLQWPWLQRLPSTVWRLALELLPTAAVVLWAVALGGPGPAWPALIVFWLVIIGEESVWWRLRGRLTSRVDEASSVVRRPEHSLREVADPVPEGGEEAVAGPEPGGTWDDCVLQQLTRSRGPDGEELVVGVVREPFLAGQRTLSIHVAFCPPLGRPPAVEAWQLEGAEASIKLAEIRTYGMRLDLRLRRGAESAGEVLVQFEARVAAESAHLPTTSPADG
jgi:hypothetical protein